MALGNALEMYDFQIFGYYAPAIAATFFPNRSEFVSLMLSLTTFGAGFLMRPLGAIVLGAYVDHHGRRAGLLLTLALMGAGTLSIALSAGLRDARPGRAAVGPGRAAGAGLLRRSGTGRRLGVSFRDRAARTQGLLRRWQSGSQQVAVMFAAVLGIVLAASLSAGQMAAGAGASRCWPAARCCRICSHAPVAGGDRKTFLQRNVPRRERSSAPCGAHRRVVGLGMLMSTMTTVCFYLVTTYTPTYGTKVLHLSPLASLIATLCVGACNFAVLPLSGALSDRIGRRPILIACTVTALLTAYPALLWLTSAPSMARLILVELWISFFYASYNGAMAVYLTEIMPAEMKTSGFALAYSLATAVFGGFTPAISHLPDQGHRQPGHPRRVAPFAAVCGLTAVLLLGSTSPGSTPGEPVPVRSC